MKTICSVLLFVCSLTVCYSQNLTSFIVQDSTKAYKEQGYPAIFIDSVFFSMEGIVGINPSTISKIDIKSYKIQKDYIMKVNCIQSKEIDGFDKTIFTIVQILTKTRENRSEASPHIR